jgi:hypothetical protein
MEARLAKHVVSLALLRGRFDELIAWWSFGQIRNIPEEYPHELGAVVTNAGKEYLFFADYCILVLGVGNFLRE